MRNGLRNNRDGYRREVKISIVHSREYCNFNADEIDIGMLNFTIDTSNNEKKNECETYLEKKEESNAIIREYVILEEYAEEIYDDEIMQKEEKRHI